ncbi:MAG: hypothetical protein V2I47_02280 [Bacteroidales bacterium]|nr:hypothetical protein [Bacteroidales bacterium]
MKNSIFIILISSLMLYKVASGQGCNDAGLCSLGDLDGQGLSGGNKYNTQLSYFFALGEQQSLLNTVQFEQKFGLFRDRGQVFIQLPFRYIYGNLGPTYGLGDVSVGFNYTFAQSKEMRASFLVAAKIPSNASNKTINGKGAPMVYQASLGTYALALGSNLMYKKWQFGIGYLKPFGSNRNYFYHDEWPGNEDALEYIEMQDLARGDDAMIRLNRFFYTKKSRFNTGLLALYRIQKDIITQGTERLALDNSNGLTLNINLGYQQVLNNEDAITLTLAAPLITREVRVDGLTSTFVVMLTYAFGSKKASSVFEDYNFKK